MMQYFIFPAGLAISLLLCTAGAWFSRACKFDYSVLALCCFLNYFMTGYTAAEFFTINASICMSASLAIIDCTMGADLSRKIGYYTRVPHRQRQGSALIEARMLIIAMAGVMGLWGATVAGIPY